MSGRRERRCTGRSASGRMLLLLVLLLPALLLGQALGGAAAWMHSHGVPGNHVHLLTDQVDPGHSEKLHDWHASQHRHEHEHEHGGDFRGHVEDAPIPAGLLLEIPRVLAVPGDGHGLAHAPGMHLSAQLPAPRWQCALAPSTQRQVRPRAGWPPRRTESSGVAALLRSSHALLI